MFNWFKWPKYRIVTNSRNGLYAAMVQDSIVNITFWYFISKHGNPIPENCVTYTDTYYWFSSYEEAKRRIEEHKKLEKQYKLEKELKKVKEALNSIKVVYKEP